jgi:hypothetical protein
MMMMMMAAATVFCACAAVTAATWRLSSSQAKGACCLVWHCLLRATSHLEKSSASHMPSVAVVMAVVVELRGAVVHHGGDVTVVLQLALDTCRVLDSSHGDFAYVEVTLPTYYMLQHNEVVVVQFNLFETREGALRRRCRNARSSTRGACPD